MFLVLSVRNPNSYVRTEEFKFPRTYSTYILELYVFHSDTVCIIVGVKRGTMQLISFDNLCMGNASRSD